MGIRKKLPRIETILEWFLADSRTPTKTGLDRRAELRPDVDFPVTGMGVQNTFRIVETDHPKATSRGLLYALHLGAVSERGMGTSEHIQVVIFCDCLEERFCAIAVSIEITLVCGGLAQ